MSLSAALSLFMTEPWQLIATWGVLSGIGCGCVASVLGATIVNRWFTTNRGLVMGLLSASTATGTLVFLPVTGGAGRVGGWRPVVIAVAVATAALMPLVLLLVPERPADRSALSPMARAGSAAGRRGNARQFAAHRLRDARRRRPRRATSGFCSPPSSSAASPPTAWSARI